MLKIEIPFKRELFIKAQSLKQRVTIRSIQTNALVCIFVGIFLIFLNENSSENPISFAISWAALLFGMLCLFQYLEANLKFKRYIKEVADRFEVEQMDCEFIFDPEGISYKDKEKSFTCRWSLLKGYSLSKEHLILHVLGKTSCDVVIDRIHIPEDKFLLLDRYLTENLKQVLL